MNLCCQAIVENHDENWKFWVNILVSLLLAWFTYFQLKKKIEGDKTIHISKEKFDEEFEIYKDLWKSCVELIAAIDSSIQTIKTNASQQNDLYPVNQEIHRVHLKCLDLSNQIRNNKPFFDTSVFNKIKDIEKSVTDSKIDNQDHWLNISIRDFNSKNMNVLTDLKNEVENISEVIRTRIKEVENVI